MLCRLLLRDGKALQQMRDAARLSVPALRDMLQTLAAADTALKTGRGDGRTVLEETVARLLMRARQRA